MKKKNYVNIEFISNYGQINTHTHTQFTVKNHKCFGNEMWLRLI